MLACAEMDLLSVDDPIFLMRKAELGVRFLYLALHAARVQLLVAFLKKKKDRREGVRCLVINSLSVMHSLSLSHLSQLVIIVTDYVGAHKQGYVDALVMEIQQLLAYVIISDLIDVDLQ